MMISPAGRGRRPRDDRFHARDAADLTLGMATERELPAYHPARSCPHSGLLISFNDPS